MSCVAPSAEQWRDSSHDWGDDYVLSELERAWTLDFRGKLPYQGPPYNRTHHDWTNFRTATLREARIRGLDISITGLGT